MAKIRMVIQWSPKGSSIACTTVSELTAENLLKDRCHQNLMKVCSAVGSVKTIRTCPPQTSNTGASSASRLGKVDGMPSPYSGGSESVAPSEHPAQAMDKVGQVG